MLLAYAEKLCRTGYRVLYVTRDWEMARNCHLRANQSVGELAGFRVFRSNGNERILHESGGEVRFLSAACEGRGLTADTLILDDVAPDYADAFYPLLSAAEEPRVVVASL
jgi:hypothetical protein